MNISFPKDMLKMLGNYVSSNGPASLERLFDQVDEKEIVYFLISITCDMMSYHVIS